MAASPTIATTFEQARREKIPLAGTKNNYIVEDLLGTGRFSHVYRARVEGTDTKVALKVIHINPGVDTIKIDLEVTILERLIALKEPHIIALLEAIKTDPDNLILVTELCEGGELYNRLCQKESYSEADAAVLMHQLLSALVAAHSIPIIHRDLKLDNLLLVSKDNDCNIKVSDFGLARLLEGRTTTFTLCGTPMYIAPEVANMLLHPGTVPDGYGTKVDIWACGVIGFLLLCGCPPFYDKDLRKLYNAIASADYFFDDEYWEDISPLGKKFIESLLTLNPEERPSAAEALQHEWFRYFGVTEELAEASDLPRRGNSLISAVSRLRLSGGKKKE